jgi:signal transduction histidine kinase
VKWPSRPRAVAAGLVAAGLAATLVPLFVDGWWIGQSMSNRLALAAASWMSISAGLIVRARRPDSPLGTWVAITGVVGMPAFLVGAESPLLSGLSAICYAIGAGMGCAVIVTFPTGRPDRAAWAVVATGAASAIADRVLAFLSFDPVAAKPGWTTPNPLYHAIDPAAIGLLQAAFLVAGLTFLGLVGVYLVRRWRRISGPASRTIAPVLGGGLAFVVAASTLAVVEAAGIGDPVLTWARAARVVSFGAIPLGFLVGILRVRMTRSALADLVVELGETPEPAQLRRALAGALGDPTLEVLLWSPEAAAYVDGEGALVRSPDQVAGTRAVTLLERGGNPLAAILHDAALLEDPGLVASVATAVRLTVENDRLQAAIRAQLAEVNASRARIVEATDAERRRIERDIHDGAQQRLIALALALRVAQGRPGAGADPELASILGQASDEARLALRELRELARGIHPAILTEAGLEAAMRSLVERAAVPTDVATSLDRRLPAAIEATAYFVVSEALANVAKHALATSARVTVTASGNSLMVEIGDDGAGGADPDRGTGLRGLRDRVEAVGGSLEVRSPVGGGTVVRAVIPIDVQVPSAEPGSAAASDEPAQAEAVR